SGVAIKTFNKINVNGQVEELLLGNGLLQTNTYNAYGLLTGIKTANGSTNIQNISYTMDNAKGLLLNRKDVNRNLTENFGYDALQRLTSYGLSTAQKTITYNNATGNILTKSDAGTYKYTLTGKPYATSSITSNGSPLPAITQQVTYTSFSRPKQITEGTYAADFVYDENAQRARMVMKSNGSTVYTRYYFAGGQYEKTVQGSTVKTILYLDGSPYDASVALETNAGITRLLYIGRDHLGSITHLTDAGKVLQAEYSYDAWGRMRNPATLAVYNPGAEPALLLNRGYTGHEHLKEFGLINMNARLYDALVGRMISPDNYVQDPLDPRNYNRYVYAGNNPLKFTDPDGNFFIPMLIGAAISVITNGINNVVHDQAFFNGAGRAALIGGIGGAFSFGIGQAAAGMSGFGKVAFQTLAHGHLGGMMSAINGGSYGSGFLSGALGSLAASGTGVLLQNVNSKFAQAVGVIGGGAISGGAGSKIAGGNFWDGFRNGAISSGLNHGTHTGLFGEGLMMASITGRTRHLFGPDAVSLEAVGDVSSGIGINLEKGGLFVLRGKESGLYSLNDLGVGIGGISISGGVEAMKYYSSAANVLKSQFYGNRYEGNLSITLASVNLGITGMISRDVGNGFFVIVLGYSLALDAMPFNIGFGFNKGVTTDSFYKLNTIRDIFKTWW
ncbi:MAG TPA: RHS repeat-associated core domain-containing protein, partial [Agriterribacter sp.]|nr:RHS repeat-associated core domain-containing protein [Agriterribacter sp.]